MFFNRKELSERLGREVVLGFTASTFDLFHAGHVAMLQESKSICDYLVVGLMIDPTIDRPDTKNKPVQTPFERYVQVGACKYVDEIIPFTTEKELEDMILLLQPDIRIVGEEYKGVKHTGVGLCPIHYNKRRHSFSSTDLRKRILEAG